MTDIYNTYGVYTDLHMIAQIQCACVYGRTGRYIYILSFMHVLGIRIYSFDTLTANDGSINTTVRLDCNDAYLFKHG